MKKFLFSIATVLMCAGLPILTSCGNNKTATEQTDGTDDAVAEGRERVQKTLEQFSSQLPQPMGAVRSSNTPTKTAKRARSSPSHPKSLKQITMPIQSNRGLSS